MPPVPILCSRRTCRRIPRHRHFADSATAPSALHTPPPAYVRKHVDRQRADEASPQSRTRVCTPHGADPSGLGSCLRVRWVLWNMRVTLTGRLKKFLVVGVLCSLTLLGCEPAAPDLVSDVPLADAGEPPRRTQCSTPVEQPRAPRSITEVVALLNELPNRHAAVFESSAPAGLRRPATCLSGRRTAVRARAFRSSRADHSWPSVSEARCRLARSEPNHSLQDSSVPDPRAAWAERVEQLRFTD